MNERSYDEVEKPRAAEYSAEFDRSSGPPLTADTVEDFLLWAGGVPVGEVDAVRERIAAARDQAGVVERLFAELWTLPVLDAGRHVLLLSTLGELRDDRATPELARFVWSPVDELAPPPGSEGTQYGGCTFPARTGEVLQARATEMLSFIGSDQAIDETLRIAAEHPLAGVRSAAIDAHLFNHDDSPEEMERLRGRVRDDDAPLIGRPRFLRGGDAEEFRREVVAFYERNPQLRPPQEVGGGLPPDDAPPEPRESG